MGCSSFRMHPPALTWGLPRPPWAAGESLLSCLEYVLLSFFSDLGAHKVVSHIFPPPSPLPEPFLNSLSEVPPPWLQGLAMPCSGCVGICWNWHRMALAALWRGCLAVPTASAWAQTPPKITENIWYAEPGAFV